MRNICSYENLSLYFIAILLALGALYSPKSFSFWMPLFTLTLIFLQGRLKNISLYLSPPFYFSLLLLIWAGVSVFWATAPNPALKTFAGLAFTWIFSFTFIACTRRAPSELIEKVYLILKTAGFFLITLTVIQAYADEFNIKFFNKEPNISYMMKPTGSILGLTTFVGCAFLWIHKHKFLAVYIFFLLVLIIKLTLCQTAMYGLMFASLVFVLSYLIPFWTTRVAMVSSYTFLILSPLLFFYVLPSFLEKKINYLNWIVNNSFFHRFLAWKFYAGKFFESPILGWGVESSRYIPTALMLSEGYENTIHPHNNSLQVYVELGLLGGVLFALFFSSLFWMVEKHVKDRLCIAVCNATISFGFITAEITHNLWRNYWLSVVTLTGGLIILFIKAREAQLHDATYHLKPSLAQ